MKKFWIPLIVILVGTIIPGLACNPTRETIHPSPGVQSTTSSPVPTASPTPTSPNSTPLTALTAKPRPTDLPIASPIAPTPTSAPFLPANLAVISPQNASELKPVAVLSDQGASVVSYSPDSRRVAAGMFGTNHIKIWDLASGQELLTLRGHTDPRIISYLAFSPDGSQLASGAQGWDAPNDSFILWDANTGRELHRYEGVLGAVSLDWRLVALTQREQD